MVEGLGRVGQADPEPEPEPDPSRWFHVTHVTEGMLDNVLKAQAYIPPILRVYRVSGGTGGGGVMKL